MSVVAPLDGIRRQLPEHGRIKLGHKTQAQSGKDKPTALHKFRFTSVDQSALEQLAVIYGGTVRPWHDDAAQPKDQFELYSEAEVINVVIPGIDNVSQWYERWNKGGCERRCDGVTVEIARKAGNDDWDLVEEACRCEAEGALSCIKTTRCGLVLPDIAFGGVWRVESKGEQAGVEIPTMHELIAGIQQQSGMLPATLRIHRYDKGRKHYVVPKLALVNSLQEIASGQAQRAALLPHHGDTPAELGRGNGEGLNQARAALNGGPLAEEDIVDAELVEDGEWVDGWRQKADTLAGDTEWAKRLMLTGEDILGGLCLFVTNGKRHNAHAITETQGRALNQTLDDLYDGVAVVTGVAGNGALELARAAT